jgi:two-component system, NarL family, nitrate/nitrite response regulator NarL
MPLNPASEDIAVFSKFLYRAESLALAIGERTGHRTTAVTRPDLAVLAGFGIILIDLDTTIGAAAELIRAITVRRPQTKVVVLGLEESEESVVKLAEAGASGYVPPAMSLEGLIAVLHSVEKSEFTCPPNITYALYAHLARLAGGNRALRQSPVLTTREKRVLDLLSQSLTNKEIAASLCISECTAKNHVHRILKKLGWRSRNLATGSQFRRPPASVSSRTFQPGATAKQAGP